MRSRMRFAGVLSLPMAALMLSVSGWAESLTVTKVSGEVQATPVAGSAVALKQGDTVGPGTVVRTGRDGRMTAEFDAQDTIEVYPESRFELKAPVSRKAAQGTALLLHSGRVGSVLNNWPAGKTYAVTSSVGAFSAKGTEYDSAYQLGPVGEFVGGATVTRGEVGYTCPELTVPSITAGGALSVTRIVGMDGVFFEMTTTGNGVTVEIAGSHVISVAANTTVHIAIGVEYKKSFIAVGLVQGSATVGTRTLSPADGVVWVRGTEALPNGGGRAFMDAVRVESTAYAQLQLPGLTPEQIATLEQTRLSASNAITSSAIGAGVLPQYHPPFVPERPIGFRLSPSGNP